MVEALLVLLIAPFVGGGLIWIVLLMADAVVGAAADFVGN